MWSSKKRGTEAASGEKLGKLVSDLSLGATLLDALDGWLASFLGRPRTVPLRFDRAEAELCCDIDRSSLAGEGSGEVAIIASRHQTIAAAK